MSTMKVSDKPRLSLAEWVVLCLVCEQPTHGWAIAALLGRDGDLGQIWHVQKSAVYRAMDRLEQLGYVGMIRNEPSSHGPVKSLSQATLAGERAAEGWLGRPVDHPRDVRSQLLIKLALRERIGADSSELLRLQHAQLAPIAAVLSDRLHHATGLQQTLALWRSESISATLRFLEATAQPISSSRASVCAAPDGCRAQLAGH
jgi:DNA-binding PadR family transcriptional regulator